MKARGIFITGTDTGVGKTYIGCLLARAIAKKLSVGVFKPFLTGALTDAIKLKKSSGTELPIKSINPVFSKYPLAPYPALELEKKKINLKSVYGAYRKIMEVSDFIIAEGAGGLYVPVTKNIFMIDVIKKLKLPVLLVARAGLGTLNHTILSVKALKEKKIKVIAVVLNNYTGDDIAQKTNPKVLKKISNIPLFVVEKNRKIPPRGLLSCVLKNSYVKS